MYKADDERYSKMVYRRCGKSGLKLPVVSFGMWQNCGFGSDFANVEKMCRTAFDNGITYFDLANNYGNPYNGSSEENFGKVLDRGLRAYRDELVISTKAGYEMWDGPYGDRNGSRKYLTASLDQSLKRMGLEYVDIYYHHIYDPETPAEETALALDNAVKRGKALYVGISNYNSEQTAEILSIFKELKTPFILNQPSYSIFNRWIEEDRLDKFAVENGFGLAVYSPLRQGLLTDRYLNGVPENSRASRDPKLKNLLTPDFIEKLNALNDLAKSRGQTLSEMALSWVLHNEAVTTVIMGASSPEQIIKNVKASQNLNFTNDEITKIKQLS